jgi:hypothetical protein
MDAQLYKPLHDLRREVMAARVTGRVVVEFDDGVAAESVAEARHVADAMVAMVNLPRLGPHWFDTDRLRAASILMAVLHWDLETFSPLVPEAEAAALLGRVFGFFPDDAVYLTNVRPHADTSLSPHRWASGAEIEELDAGVCVVSSELVGLVWVEDRPRRRHD